MRDSMKPTNRWIKVVVYFVAGISLLLLGAKTGKCINECVPSCNDPCHDACCNPNCNDPCHDACCNPHCNDPCHDACCNPHCNDPCHDACCNPICTDPCSPCSGSGCKPIVCSDPCTHCVGGTCVPICPAPSPTPPCKKWDCASCSWVSACPAGQLCCGVDSSATCYDPSTTGCCGPNTFGSYMTYNLSTEGCCNGWKFTESSSCCISGNILPKDPIINLSDCPNRVARPPPYTPSANGCGAEGGVVFVPALLDNPMDDSCGSFAGVCTNHDICYGTCLSDKDACDTTFDNAMIGVCDGCYPIASLERISCHSYALTYYEAVHLGGYDAWVGGQKQGCICCP